MASKAKSMVWCGVALALASIAGLASGEEPIPDFYGLYAVSGGTLTLLYNVHSDTRVKQFSYSISQTRLGLAEIGDVQLAPDTHFLAFGPDWRELVSQVRLWRLNFITEMQVTVIAAGFKQMTVNPNLWLAGPAQGLRVGPVRGQADLFKIVPDAPLQPGAYVVGLGPLDQEFLIGNDPMRFVSDFYVGEKPVRPAAVGTQAGQSRGTTPPAPSSPQTAEVEVAWTADCAKLAAEPPLKDSEMKSISKADDKLAMHDMGFKDYMAYSKNKNRGSKAYQEKNYKGAASLFEEVLRARPNEWYAHYMLAATYAASDNPDGALAHSCVALKRSHDKWIYYTVAQAFGKKGDKQACLRWLDSALGAGLALSKAQMDQDFQTLAQDQDYMILLSKHSVPSK